MLNAKLMTIFSALSVENRYRTWTTLLGSARAMNQSELCDKLSISQGMMAHNLKILEQAELITEQPSGKFRFYQANDVTLKLLRDELMNLEADRTLTVNKAIIGRLTTGDIALVDPTKPL